MKRIREKDGSRRNEIVDKCDSTVRDRVWLFSSFNPNGCRVYDTIIDNVVAPLKDISLNFAIPIAQDIRRFTEGSSDYRVLIIDEFSQGNMIEIENGKAISYKTFVQFPIPEGRQKIEQVLSQFDILPYILNCEVSALKGKDIFQRSGLDKTGLRTKLAWSFIEFIKRRSPVFSAWVTENKFNNDFTQNFEGIIKILGEATGELATEIKKVIDKSEDPLDRLFDFPLYAKFILSTYNNGYLQNYVHNMNSPFKLDYSFKVEGTTDLKFLVINGYRFLD